MSLQLTRVNVNLHHRILCKEIIERQPLCKLVYYPHNMYVGWWWGLWLETGQNQDIGFPVDSEFRKGWTISRINSEMISWSLNFGVRVQSCYKTGLGDYSTKCHELHLSKCQYEKIQSWYILPICNVTDYLKNNHVFKINAP